MMKPSLALATLVGLLLAPSAVLAADPIYTSGLFGPVAISGADPVGYFEEGKYVEGAKAFEAEWQGATWRFASAGNRNAFLADPDKYAPQFGGYCAYAVAHGNTVSSDPEAFTIVADKLYLNYSMGIQKKWLANRDEFIRKANENWPGVLE